MKRAASVALLALLVVACTTSRVKPKADIDLGGTVHRQDGRAVPGARLALTREGDPGDVILTVASLGFACLDRKQPPAICDDARFATAGSDGAFTYKIKGRDTQSTLGFSAVLSLSTALEPKADEASGSSTTYRFHVQTEKLDLPIRLWEPKIAARTGSFGARASFPRLPAQLLPSPVARGTARYTIEFVRGSEIVWRLTDARTVTTFDPRILEDSSGTMRVIASASNLDLDDRLGDEVAFALRGGARSYESPLGPPLSRGKPCGVMDERGTGSRYPISPCPLTDGRFSNIFSPTVCAGATGCVEPQHDSAFLDLGTQVAVSFLTVRGCQNFCRVEGSPDGRTWFVLGLSRAEQAMFSYTTPRRARFVRAAGSSGANSLTEISVWTGRPRLPEASLLVTPQRFPGGPGSFAKTPVAAAPTDGRDFNFWALVAAMLLGAVGGAGAMVVIRRRSRRAT